MDKNDVSAIESGFFGCVLIDPQRGVAVGMKEGVRPDWFACDPWAAMWAACEAMWNDGRIKDADSITIWQEAKRIAAGKDWDHPSDLLQTVDFMEKAIEPITTPDPTKYLYDLRGSVCERRVKRIVAEGYKQFATDWPGAPVHIRNGIDDVLRELVAGKKTDAKAIYTAIMDEYRMAHQKRVVEKDLNWVPGLRMPWPELTRTFLGVRPGLHIIAARPSVGKTSFAINLMRYWLDEGHGVLFNSLDMPKKEVMRRFIAERARVSVSKALFTPTKRNLEKMDAACAELTAKNLEFMEIKRVEDFVTMIAIEKARGKCDVVVVDYLQLLKSDRVDNANEYARVSYVSDMLKATANELEVPLVSLSQLNRDSAKDVANGGREPGLADLRGSGSIEQDAFTVTILHRDQRVTEKWKTNPPSWFLPDGASTNPLAAVGRYDAIKVIVAKSQNGGKASFPFVVDGPYYCWKLGDYEQKPVKLEEGVGATKREVEDNTNLFSRFHADWRNDEWEQAMAHKIYPYAVPGVGPLNVLINR